MSWDNSIRLLDVIEDRCARSIDKVPAQEHFVFQTIAAVACYLRERGLAGEADHVECLLLNDLLPQRLVPQKGTPEYRALLREVRLGRNAKRQENVA